MSKIRVPLSIPDIGEEEVEAVSRVLRRQWLTMGEETQAFETEFAALVDAPHAVAVSNCTAALHLALAALDIGPGDEVLVPSLTFVATANAVRYCGATPVFVDILSADDLTMDPADAASKLTERTRAVMPVHHSGYAADISAFRALARERGIALVEDAAQSIGASRDGVSCGVAGDLACFSFYSTKNATTAEGGMVTATKEDLAQRVRLLRSHGMTASVLERDRGEKFGYDVVGLGYNYRIDEMRAAMGRVQLAKLPARNAHRRELVRRYWDGLEGVPGLELPFRDAPGVSACHLMPTVVPAGVDRNDIANGLRERGIQSSVHYRPVHTLTAYADRREEARCPVTDDVAARELSLPLYGTMPVEHVDIVVEAMRDLLG
jgi:dTDP-4-amino-4,6-dideoxygalactose transaminase